MTELNRRAYDAIAAQWNASRQALPALDRPFVEAVIAGLAAGERVLDLGCGTGRPIAELACARGLRVTGIDQSAAMIGHARQRLPDAEWIVASLEAVTLQGPYAGAFLWDVLFHLPRAQHEALLRKVLACLRPGAALALTVGGSAQPAFTDTMFGATFFYDSWTPAETQDLLQRLGAHIERSACLNPPTAGRDKGRHAFVVRRAAVAPAPRL